MSDWDFLYDMHNSGYSSEQIADAAACGYNPWECELIDLDWIDPQFTDTEADQHSKNFKSREGFPFSTLEQTEIFHDLIECAKRHLDNTGRYLQIWGELGEIFAEIKLEKG